MKIKETIYELRQQPVMTAVSIIGTALAIFLVMIVVMLNQVKVEPFAPESNRDRWLVNQYISVAKADNPYWCTNAGMSFNTVREIFYKMETPEVVSAFNCVQENTTLSVPGQLPVLVEGKKVDHNFFKVMDFTFINGGPFDEAQLYANDKVIVINESMARKLYGTTDVVNNDIWVDHEKYRVIGVVKDVSLMATLAYAHAWMPFDTRDALTTWCDGTMGRLGTVILAKSSDDFPAIRQEYKRLFDAYFDNFDEWVHVQRERPYVQEVSAYSKFANMNPNMGDVYLERYMMFAILLLVPAINLSSMTHSRLRRQKEIIGIRRAFGATKSRILGSLLLENFIVTLVAGAIGLTLTVIFALIADSSLFYENYTFSTMVIPSTSRSVSLGMLLHWSTFAWALGFCFILNLLSAGLPAFQASRINIVNALAKK